jgi:phthalate 4,5-dioxygenase oxygenase subunit
MEGEKNMLSHEDNELLSRVCGDAPMGKMLRRYWLPACLSEEVPDADGTPKRVKLLGENLLAFRDTNGRIGLIDEYCPHRSASLVFGRNEECGIRCLYHGWKMDVDGNLTDVPTEPEGSKIMQNLKQKAYPTREAGDMIWTYMGPPEEMPPFPEFEWTKVAQSNRAIVKIVENANWVQAMEGAIDSAHSSFLHSSYRMGVRPSKDTAPKLETEDTTYGFRYAAIRKPEKDADKNKYVRVTLFVAPIFCFVPPKEGYGSVHMFVPMDDGHTAFYGVNFSHDKALDTEEIRKRRRAAVGVDLDQQFRKIRTMENLYLQDREAMKSGQSFTGIEGVPNQDMAMQESMGSIVDRTKEHLGISDIAIIKMRRLLLQSVHSFVEGGKPIGLTSSVPYDKLRSDAKVIPIDQPWQTVGAYAGEYVPTGTQK